MKKISRAMALILALMLTLCNSAFALDDLISEPIEPDYVEIVNEIFPTHQDQQISPQWTSGEPDSANPLTHGYITQVAYNLLRSDNSAAYTFYSGQLENLVRGSILPDSDETNSGYAWHFYGEDGTNWIGGSVTAYTKCIEHYNAAVNLYITNLKSSAMIELGRALHYLQDINVPHHSMNAVAVLTNHTEFEQLAEENRTSYVVTGLIPSNYTDANKSLGAIIDQYATTARGWYDEASLGVTADMQTAAGACVRNSQRATVTVLYKFMIDTGFLSNAK